MDTPLFTFEFEISGPAAQFAWVLLVVAIAGFSTWWALSTRGSTAVVNQFASRLGLTPQSPAAEHARRTIRRRWAFSAAGGTIGAGGLLWIFLSGSAHLAQLALWVLAALMLTEMGRTIAVLTEAKHPQQDTPRISRIAEVNTASYVPQTISWVAAGSAIGAAAIGIVTAGLQLLGTAPGSGYVSLGIGAVSLGSWFLLRALSKRLINTAQPAHDHEELRWSDALRAEALISYYQVVPLVSAWLTCLLLFTITATRTADGVEWVIVSAGPILLLLAAAAMLLTSLGSLVWRKPYQHYKRTLWANQEETS